MSKIYLVYYFTDDQDMNEPTLNGSYDNLEQAKQVMRELKQAEYNVMMEEIDSDEWYGE